MRRRAKPVADDEATTRRGGYRRRLALAGVASVAIHLLLAKGLTLTHLGLDAATDVPTARTPLTPKRAADFPLVVPRSPPTEKPVHERPLDVRVRPPEERKPLPVPRQPDRSVAERQAEEASQWVPAALVAAARIDQPRDDSLGAPAQPARAQGTSPASSPFASVPSIDPVTAATAAAAATPAAAQPRPRDEAAAIASQWRPREVALLERLTAPVAAPSRSARDREADELPRTAVTPRAASPAASAADADSPIAPIALPAATDVSRITIAPAERPRQGPTTGVAASTLPRPALPDDDAAATAAAGTSAAAATSRASRTDAGDGSGVAVSPARRPAQAAANAGDQVAAIDLPAAAATGATAMPAAAPLSPPTRTAPGLGSGRSVSAPPAAAEGDEPSRTVPVADPAVGIAGRSSRPRADREGTGDPPPVAGGAAPRQATIIASGAGAAAVAPIAVPAAPTVAAVDAAGPATPVPAAVGRIAAGAGTMPAAAAIARPGAGVAGDVDDEGLSVSIAAGTIAGDATGRRAAVTEAAAVQPLPPARVSAAALPADGRVRDVAEAFARRTPASRDTDREPTPDELRARAIVDRGLEFLARSQQPDGRWSLERFAGGTPADAPKLRSDTAATGLALLSFLGAGHDHFDGPHRDTVRRGLEFLLATQRPDGDLYLPADELSNSCAWLYSHGIAAIALCEAVGMTGDPRVRPAAERACGFIAASQHPTRGGWRYTPRSDADLSVSGWMLVAARSGELAGVKTDPRMLAGVRTLLEAASSRADSSRYAYNPLKPEQRMSPLSSACMTAVGGLMRLHTGAAADDPRVVRAARVLAAMPPDYGTAARKTRDSYLWYYASQVLVHTGGPEWRDWYGRLVDTLGATQESVGAKAGSWDPLGDAPDRWGQFGGRIYVTALHLLALEVPDRHLPTYSATKPRP